ncbi:hypothetical protein GCM10009610_63860 [Pseudonocardia xinjiangensis]
MEGGHGRGGESGGVGLPVDRRPLLHLAQSGREVGLLRAERSVDRDRLVYDDHAADYRTSMSSRHDRTTILTGAVTHSETYTPRIREHTRRRASVDAVIREYMIAEVRQACELFRRGIVPTV